MYNLVLESGTMIKVCVILYTYITAYLVLKVKGSLIWSFASKAVTVGP